MDSCVFNEWGRDLLRRQVYYGTRVGGFRRSCISRFDFRRNSITHSIYNFCDQADLTQTFRAFPGVVHVEIE